MEGVGPMPFFRDQNIPFEGASGPRFPRRKASFRMISCPPVLKSHYYLTPFPFLQTGLIILMNIFDANIIILGSVTVKFKNV